MEEQLISYETAKLAKEKGFDEKVYREYDKSGYLRCTSKSADVVLGPYDELLKSTEYPAPTQSLLQKWLREEHNCIVEVTFYSENIESIKDIKYTVEIDYYGKDFHNIGDSSDYYSSGYDTYEKALEVGLFEGLKLIK